MGNWIARLKNRKHKAIASFFNVSCDYLLGVVDYRNPKNEKPATELHLTEKALENLYKCHSNDYTSSLNLFLESDEFYFIIQIINDVRFSVSEDLFSTVFDIYMDNVELTEHYKTKDEKTKQVIKSRLESILKRELIQSPMRIQAAKQEIAATMNDFVDRIVPTSEIANSEE